MKICPAVPENGCLIVLVDGKKNKKQQLQNIRIRLLPEGGCVKKKPEAREQGWESWGGGIEPSPTS